MRSLPTVPLALVALLAASPALAQVPVAEKLFREAQDSMKANHYEEACPKFAESNRLDPQLGTLLNLAACHEKEGKLASAWAEYTTLVDLATHAGDRARADYARKRITAIEPAIPQLELRVPAGTTLAEVKLDEQTLGSAATMTSIPVDPGTHTLAFSTATQHWVQSFTLGAAGKATVDVKPPESSAPPPTPGPAPTSTAASTAAATPASTDGGSSGRGLRTAGFIAGGVGIAALGVGGVFGAIALGNKSDVDAHCQGSLCDPTGFSAQQDAHTHATISTVGFVAGGVLVAAGLTLLFVGSSNNTQASALVVPTRDGMALAW